VLRSSTVSATLICKFDWKSDDDNVATPVWVLSGVNPTRNFNVIIYMSDCERDRLLSRERPVFSNCLSSLGGTAVGAAVGAAVGTAVSSSVSCSNTSKSIVSSSLLKVSEYALTWSVVRASESEMKTTFTRASTLGISISIEDNEDAPAKTSTKAASSKAGKFVELVYVIVVATANASVEAAVGSMVGPSSSGVLQHF